jgi:hypothetical protein
MLFRGYRRWKFSSPCPLEEGTKPAFPNSPPLRGGGRRPGEALKIVGCCCPFDPHHIQPVRHAEILLKVNGILLDNRFIQ